MDHLSLSSSLLSLHSSRESETPLSGGEGTLSCTVNNFTPVPSQNPCDVFEDIRFSQVDALVDEAYRDPGTSNGILSESSLHPTYRGYVQTKQDALLLLEACISGRLNPLPRPPYENEYHLLTQSGFVFIYDENTIGVKDWNDRIWWDSVHRESDFDLSQEAGKDDGLTRKTLRVLVHEVYYYLVSYYYFHDVSEGALLTPSLDPYVRDTQLRPELASQLITSHPSRHEQRLSFYSKFNESSRSARLNFTRNAFFLCQALVQDEFYEDLLKREPDSWFPNLQSDEEYWHQLSRKSIFLGVEPKKLERQATLLLSALLSVSADELPPRLPHRSEPSKAFSPSQNLSLYCEVFGITAYRPKPFGKHDPSKFVEDLARSRLSIPIELANDPLLSRFLDENGAITPRTAWKWGRWLATHLPIDYDMDRLELPMSIRDILEELSVKKSGEIFTTIAYYQMQFRDFEHKKNHMPLLLTASYSRCTRKTTRRLRDWAVTESGTSTYHQLLENLRAPSTPESLTLSLTALLSLQCIRTAEIHGSPPAQAVGLPRLDHFIRGHDAIEDSKGIVQHMIWSFLRATEHIFDSEPHGRLVQLLDPVVSSIAPLPKSPDRISDHYWTIRLPAQLDHEDGMNRVQEDVALILGLMTTPSSIGDTETEDSGEGSLCRLVRFWSITGHVTEEQKTKRRRSRSCLPFWPGSLLSAWGRYVSRTAM